MDTIVKNASLPRQQEEEQSSLPVLISKGNGGDMLEELLKRLVPKMNEYKILDTITQANAKGHRILVHGEKSHHFFVKTVFASHYTKKAWNNLRRTLLYARTEVRFYNEFLKRFENIQLTPACFHAECNLHDVVPETECAVLEITPSLKNEQALQYAQGTIVLEAANDEFYQESPLTMDEARKCLSAAAHLHAAAWENSDILGPAQQRLSKASFHLKVRNPKELDGLIESWGNFVSNFKPLAPPNFFDSLHNLGERVHDLADFVSKETSPTSTCPCATLVHGDFKAMNVFLPRDGKQHALMIDFASVGVGYGMSDVAMHITHALEPHIVNEDVLLEWYLDELHKARLQFSNHCPILRYPRDLAMRHYRLAQIDYFRFVLGRFWKSATPETFANKKHSKNTTLVNRNIEAALAFITKVNCYVNEIEEEIKSHEAREQPMR